MGREWKRERDWWLDHFYQWSPEARRQSNTTALRKSDYVAIPVPTNIPTPLVEPCLIWRWGLDGNGYGHLGGKGTHIVAYEESHSEKIVPGFNILHLCHRPFCIQPAHLYQGTAKQNSEDRNAVFSEMGSYATWSNVTDRWNKAMTEFYWPAPQVEELSAGFSSREALNQR